MDSVLKPYGLVQHITPTPIDYDKLKEDLESMTDEERMEAVFSYIRSRYMQTTRWQG